MLPLITLPENASNTNNDSYALAGNNGLLKECMAPRALLPLDIAELWSARTDSLLAPRVGSPMDSSTLIFSGRRPGAHQGIQRMVVRRFLFH